MTNCPKCEHDMADHNTRYYTPISYTPLGMRKPGITETLCAIRGCPCVEIIKYSYD